MRSKFSRSTKRDLPYSVGNMFMKSVLSYVNPKRKLLRDEVDQMQELMWNSTYFFWNAEINRNSVPSAGAVDFFASQTANGPAVSDALADNPVPQRVGPAKQGVSELTPGIC